MVLSLQLNVILFDGFIQSRYQKQLAVPLLKIHIFGFDVLCRVVQRSEHIFDNHRLSNNCLFAIRHSIFENPSKRLARSRKVVITDV